MKCTLNWLKDFLKTDANAEAIAERLTSLGLEVESLTHSGAGLEDFTVAHIIDAQPHPQADKLQICRVATHSGERQIVCGAPNARAGIKVILADIGDIIPTNNMVIKPSQIRGVESAGMLCSARELGLGNDHDGIMELPHDAEIGSKIIDVLQLNDTLFDIAITPNRGDCLGIYGIARDLAASGMGVLKPLDKVTHKVTIGANLPDYPVRIDSTHCSHFIAYKIENITMQPSPEWLQKRLLSVGISPISAPVDVTNYISHSFARPLHVYDAQRINGIMTVRESKPDESFAALNEKTYNLPEALCVIADDTQLLGLAGVMGGASSSVQDTTTSLILEAAWFDPIAVGKAGRATYIDSDARARFERHVDPQMTAYFAAVAAQMITSICGGTITARGEQGAALSAPKPIAYDPAYVTTRCAIDVAAQQQNAILTALGCDISADWQVTAPGWRSDLTIAEDLVEEIVRIVGYDALPATPLPAYSPAIRTASADDKIRSTCLARGLDEVVHFAFTSAAYAAAFAQQQVVTVANPISIELNTMRPHLLCDLLPALARNAARGQQSQCLFEIGTVFAGVTPDAQMLRATTVRCGTTSPHWQHKSRAYDIYDAKADVLALLESLDVSTDALMTGRDVPPYFHPGKAGRLSLGPKNTIAYFGEIHPAILRLFAIDFPVMAAECLIDNVPVKKKQAIKKAFVANDYQASTRDYAFIVDKDAPAQDIVQALYKVDKHLVKSVHLFDVYAGQHLEEGKKSLAFSVMLQAPDRTLSEDDLTRTHNAIIAAAAKKGAVLR